MSDSDGDIVKDFLVESYENLDRLDRDLVGLEKNPHDRDALAGVFRTIHTIKGTCGFSKSGTCNCPRQATPCKRNAPESRSLESQNLVVYPIPPACYPNKKDSRHAANRGKDPPKIPSFSAACQAPSTES